MNKISTYIIVITAFILCGSFHSNAAHVIDDSKNPQTLLLVLSASSGSLEGDTLTLNGVSTVLYFADQPSRVAGHVSVKKLVDTWSDGSDSFKKDPPNAVLSILNDEGADIVIEIVEPSVSGDSLLLNIKTISGTIPESFNQASLFIDEFINGHAWTGT